MSTNTITESETISEADVAAIEAIMAASGAERDQAAHALTEVRAELAGEPEPALATNEAESVLGKYTSRRFRIESERTRIKEQTDAMLRNLDAKLAGLDFVMRPQAEAFTKTLLAGKKGKSVKFSHGTCGFRAVPGSVEIPTEKMPDVIAYCEANIPDAIRIRKEVVKTPLAELYKLGGEMVPGVVYHAPRDKFYVS